MSQYFKRMLEKFVKYIFSDFLSLKEKLAFFVF